MSSPPIVITPDQWEIVHAILETHLPQFEVWAFGSRARGTAKPYSDLDIVVLTESPLSFRQSARLGDAFAESNLPFKVDIVDWATTSEAFRAIIAAEKVVVKERPVARGRGECDTSETRSPSSPTKA